MKKSLFLLFGLLIISACTTSQPAPTSTSLPPTVTPPPTSCKVVEGICLELTFDGESCIYEGPTDLKPGPVTIIFHNESDDWAGTNLMRLLGDKTLEDLIYYHGLGDEPGTHHANKDWTITSPGIWKEIRAGESHFWEGALEPGIHAWLCVRTLAWPEPLGVYFGTGWTIEK